MSRREFSSKVMVEAFHRARNQCEGCGARLSVGKFAYDHIVPDALGGEPTLENCQVLCLICHGQKTSKADVPAIAKARRREAATVGAKAPSRTPLPFGRKSKWRKKLTGEIVPRRQ